MSLKHLWLIILIVIVIIVIVVLVYKNFGNISPPQTISSQPLALLAQQGGSSSANGANGALTATPYPIGILPNVNGYTDFAIFRPSQSLPNQFFNLVPRGALNKTASDSSQIVIQTSTSGLYLTMQQTTVFTDPTHSSTQWVGSFTATTPESAALFQITRLGNGNGYTLQHVTTGLYVIVTAVPFLLPPGSVGGSFLAPLLSLGATATTFVLSSTGT